jgi:translocation protein SEC63
MGLMAYLITVSSKTVPTIWNPYDILGISEVRSLNYLLRFHANFSTILKSASERQIKSHYRKLSLRFHPDKIRPNPAMNETIETLNDHFVELTKAYKALTDEDIRNNYIQYGHPDGKQSFSIGIALPKFIITDGNGKYVVIIYALMLGVLLPYLVGTWWYGTQRLSKEKILIESANNLFREYQDTMTEGDIVTSLSCGTEFRNIFKGGKAESGLAKLEARIFADGVTSPFAGGLTAKDKRKLEDLENGVQRKALAVLWAYLGRVDLDDSTLNMAKFEVAPIAHALNHAFTTISLAFSSTGPILAAYSLTQCLIQAIPPKASPLLQLPYMTPLIVKAIEGDAKTHMSLQKYMQIPESKRRELSVGNNLLSNDQYKTVVSVARQLPNFEVAKAFFKVVGEKYITPGSLVSLVVKGRFVPPGSFNVPDIEKLDLEDADPDEGDLDALLGKSKKAVKDKNAEEGKSIQLPLVYAPYYPRDHSPRWHIFLTDSKQGKIAVPPFAFATFDKLIFGNDGKPTFNMQTRKAQFQAPPQAGQYTFVMHLICDSYVGLDTKMEVTLIVEEASKAMDIQADDDISEPDEGRSFIPPSQKGERS